jgi:hypothetical protein
MFFQNMDVDFGSTGQSLYTNLQATQPSDLIFEQHNPFGTANSGNSWDFGNAAFNRAPQA